MNKNILFYGERGIVNSIILDIAGDLNKEKKFLESIILADKSKLNWVDNVVNVKYFVEADLSEFGSPDLIIKATTSKNENYVLFMEAKLGSYEGSALSLNNINDEKLPNSYNGNSSKINIQLAYKYRFIRASKKYNNEKSIFIEESDDTSIYNDDTKRRLKKRKVIDLWNENLKDASQYYFIALTNDLIDMVNKNTPYDENDIIPPIGDNNWSKHKKYFGITTYKALIDNQIISKEFGYSCDAIKLMLFIPSSSSKSTYGKGYPELKSFNINKWNENQKKTAELWKEWIRNISEIEMKKQDGSYSLIINNITVLKLMASNNNKIYLCIKDDNAPPYNGSYTKDEKYRIGSGIKRLFICYLVESPNNMDKEFLDFVEKFIDTREII